MHNCKMQKFFSFIRERHSIYAARQLGKPFPWTKDPVLQKYKFCNVYRELDRTTRWIAANWRSKYEENKYLWFALCVARRINFIDTLDDLGYPVQWNATRFISVLKKRKAAGLQMFGGAYMITTGGSTKDWATWQAEDVLTPLWKDRDEISKACKPKDGLQKLFDTLAEYHGFGGGFIAAQVIADLKYSIPWLCAPDWETFAAPGPGSKRGLNRVWGRPPDTPWGKEWKTKLLELKAISDSHPTLTGLMPLHAQDLQNCLCEFDKYERAQAGEGNLIKYEAPFDRSSLDKVERSALVAKECRAISKKLRKQYHDNRSTE
jgi:hypothetical protein